MKIKMTQSQYGIGVSRNAGDEIDVPEDEAKRMIEGGLAIPVRATKPEKAVPQNHSVEKADK